MARMGYRRVPYRTLVEKAEGMRLDLDLGWRIVLRGFWGSNMRTHVLDWSGSIEGPVAGACQCDNELLGPTRLTSRGPVSYPGKSLLNGVQFRSISLIVSKRVRLNKEKLTGYKVDAFLFSTTSVRNKFRSKKVYLLSSTYAEERLYAVFNN